MFENSGAAVAASANGVAEPAARKTTSSKFPVEHVTEITHYTDSLFSFRTTRAPTFRFASGQFTMIGLEADGRPLMRAYSMASAHYDEHLEFFSIKVEDGPLTSRLRHIQPGDPILVSPKPTGTLVLSNLLPGKRLFLLSTGTGFAPFASLLRDPEIYDRFDEIFVLNGTRMLAEQAYAQKVVSEIVAHEYLGDLARGHLSLIPSVTREAYHRQGRVTDLIASGEIISELAIPSLTPATDRAMICGNPATPADSRALLESLGFEEGSSGKPGAYVVERAFVER